MLGIGYCKRWLIEVVIGLDDEGDIKCSSKSVDEGMVGSRDGDVAVGVLPVVFYVC